MTRFLYIADTHLGASPMGFQQQQGYPGKLAEIIAALTDEQAGVGRLDFILHGGDMVEAATEENIMGAAVLFDLDVPVYLCLGNHDLTEPDALARWLDFAPSFFLGGSPNFTIASFLT